MRGAWIQSLLLAAGVVNAQTPAPEPFRALDVRLELTIDHPNRQLRGAITYEIENWTGTPARHVSFLVGRLMVATAVHDGRGASLSYVQDVERFHDDPMRQVTRIQVSLPRPIAAGGRTTVRVDYFGNLVGYTEVGWLYVRDRIDTAFTIIREDALAFPVIGSLSDAANRQRPRSDFTYDVAVRVPTRYLVATGGAPSRTPHDDGTATWRYRSGAPSPFLNVTVAPYDTIVGGGIRLFHFSADSLGARRTYANAQAALRLLGSWFGPQRALFNVTIAEIPDGWGSQASLVGGIIQSAAVFRDPGRSGELYHELSHLWNARDTDTPSPRWNEGLASFLEGLMREQLDGWTNRRESERRRIAWMQGRIASDSVLRVTPLIEYGRRGVTDYSYSVGELMFATFYDLVGEAEFNAIVGGYYQQFTNGGSTLDFVALAKRTSSRNLGRFFDDWLFTTRWTEQLRTTGSIGELVSHYR